MTVLIAATGDAGTRAQEALDAAGFDVERVAALADARVRGATADVVVAGDLTDGSPADLRGVLREAGAATPVVRLGLADGFEYAVARPPDPDALADAVRVARRADAYRDAVDDLYAACREHATDDERTLPTADDAVDTARLRADRAFEEARHLGDGTPYGRLFADADGSTIEGDHAPGTDEDAGAADQT